MRQTNKKKRNDFAGQLLVASPYLLDQHYSRTVVLLVGHGNAGSYGLILNRPLGRASKAIWQHLRMGHAVADRPLYFGGPAPGQMIAVHQNAALSEGVVAQDVFLAADRTQLGQLVSDNSRACRVFVGHVAWGRGELERELNSGAWMLLPASAEHVFADESQIWTHAIRAVGRSVIETQVDPRRIPTDPQVN